MIVQGQGFMSLISPFLGSGLAANNDGAPTTASGFGVNYFP